MRSHKNPDALRPTPPARFRRHANVLNTRTAWNDVYVFFTEDLADRRPAKLKTTAYAFIEAGATGSLKPVDEARLPCPLYIMFFERVYKYDELAVKKSIDLAKKKFPAVAEVEDRRGLVLEELQHLLLVQNGVV